MRHRSNHHAPLFHEVLLSRRQFLQRTTWAGGALAVTSLSSLAAHGMGNKRSATVSAGADSTLHFREIAKNTLDRPVIAAGYRAEPLIRWGDDLFGNGPFNPRLLTPEDQAKRFGYNNDYIAFMPLPRGSRDAEHGLLCVNHEYTNLRLMFPGLTKETEQLQATERQGRIEQQAQGCSVVEIKKHNGCWQALHQSTYNRRLTATTPMGITGPAAGHPRMQTRADPTGRNVLGTFANCAGGTTPWGTVLTCEENFDEYFGGMTPVGDFETEALRRYGIDGGGSYNWHRFDARFSLAQESHEANRFGWVVEYDPYQPDSVPKKRTALGRFKHECANTAISADGRVAVYSGDDEAFEYIYRFVTRDRFQADDPAANRDLLDQGTLHAAKFLPDGTLQWLPLIYGTGLLTKQNGFTSQADVVIEARRAADLLGATPMDRPEDVEASPVTGKVYASLTKNPEREAVQIDAVNRRGPNRLGYVLEMTPPERDGKRDHAAEIYRWEIFLSGGNPAIAGDEAMYQASVSADGWLTNPDNLAFDPLGRLWIATDGQGEAIHKNEGLYAADCEGPGRGSSRLFLTVPIGAETTGPCFTPDGKTLFVSVQHPSEYPLASTYDHPATRWPDFSPDMPPRPAVLVITKEDSGLIGD